MAEKKALTNKQVNLNERDIIPVSALIYKIVVTITIVVCCLGLWSLFTQAIHRIGDIETARQNEYQYAYVQVGEEWQDFELEKHTDYSRTQYKLYLIDGSIMLVQKNRCILHNGKSLEELLKQFEEG